MNSTVIVGILSFAGTLIGTVASTFVNNKLTIYRINQ